MEIDLSGLIDMHVHSGPDVRPRLLDDVAVAREAAAAGMQAIMIKSHVTLTADRAAIAEKMAPGVRVLGGLALNAAVGGFNPAAVEIAIRMGARQIWMPTMSAANNLTHNRETDARASASSFERGLPVLDADGVLLPVVLEILALIAEAGIALGTGHLSAGEIAVLVPAARALGVKRIVVTHPELPLSSVPLALQQHLAQPGVWFERCYICTLSKEAPVPSSTIAGNARAVGFQHTILSTDLGKATNVPPVDGLRSYLADLLALGIPWRDLQMMARDNPAAALGI